MKIDPAIAHKKDSWFDNGIHELVVLAQPRQALARSTGMRFNLVVSSVIHRQHQPPWEIVAPPSTVQSRIDQLRAIRTSLVSVSALSRGLVCKSIHSLNTGLDILWCNCYNWLHSHHPRLPFGLTTRLYLNSA